MHSLATSYQPVAGNSTNDASGFTQDSTHDDERPSWRRWLSSPFQRRITLEDDDNNWWHTFTKVVFGWPIAPHDGRETAWLDGLRGLAAFLVMTYHFNLNWFMPALVEEPWGANMKEHAWDLWRMPFLRLWMCSGHTQVSIFFVLSGFVLSWSSLGSIRAGNHEKLYKGLGSSVFRRWIRLYLPTVPVAFWECIELYAGWRDAVGTKLRQPTFLLQLWDYIQACELYANPFDVNRSGWSSLHPYDWTMWTIPFEFSGSLLVFFLLLAVGRIQDYKRRTFTISIVVIYCAVRANWSFWLFSNGMLIADYVRERGGFKKISDEQTTRSLYIWIAVFIFALWLGGVPAAMPIYTRPGYDWLDSLTPSWWMKEEGGGRLWWNIAGILIVLSASHLSLVRRFFEFDVLRYLGRISYMMYLTHRVVLEPALRGFRDWLLPIFGRDGYIDMPGNNSSPFHWMVTIALYFALWSVIGPAAIFVAHLATSLFDEPSVKFARWVDDRFMKGITKRVDSRNDSAAPPAPVLPVHGETRERAAPTAATGAAAPYRDVEPASTPTADVKQDSELGESVELVEMPPKPLV